MLRDGVPMHEAAEDEALVVARAPKSSVFKVIGKMGAFTRVELESGRPAFVASSDVKAGGAPTMHPSWKPEWQVTPPVLTVAAPTVVSGETVRIKGHATDDRLVRDVYIRVWNRDAKVPMKKVFYLPNRPTGDRTKLDFEAEVPLWPGSNTVQVFARESNDVQSLNTVVVLKRAAGVLAGPPDSAAPARTTTR